MIQPTEEIRNIINAFKNFELSPEQQKKLGGGYSNSAKKSYVAAHWETDMWLYLKIYFYYLFIISITLKSDNINLVKKLFFFNF